MGRWGLRCSVAWHGDPTTTHGVAWPATPVGAFVPSVDIEETEGAYRLHVELPDVRPEDVAVDVDGCTLIISGERRFYDEQDTERFRRVERSFGRFHRVIRLPGGADPDGVSATQHAGLLEIDVPNREEARARRIPVRQSAGPTGPQRSRDRELHIYPWGVSWWCRDVPCPMTSPDPRIAS